MSTRSNVVLRKIYTNFFEMFETRGDRTPTSRKPKKSVPNSFGEAIENMDKVLGSLKSLKELHPTKEKELEQLRNGNEELSLKAADLLEENQLACTKGEQTAELSPSKTLFFNSCAARVTKKRIHEPNTTRTQEIEDAQDEAES